MQPKVIIDNIAYRRIMHWINKSSHEVSGLGLLSIEPNGVFRVSHVMLVPQANTGTSTDIEAEDAAKLLYQCRDMPGELRFWWHSHVDMNVFWSGTDMDTIRKLGEAGWFLSTVFNKKREMRTAFYSVAGTETPWGKFPLFQDELETKVEPFIEPNVERWDAEYSENVKAREYQSHFQRHVWAPNTRAVSGYGGQLLGSPNIFVNSLTRKRPPGMPKTEWRKLRRHDAQYHSTDASRKIDAAKNVAQAINKSIASKIEETDVYGFSQEEQSFLARSGWDSKDIDALFELDVAPQDMLVLAATDTIPQEIVAMLYQGWEIQDILQHLQVNRVDDDIPVMDRSTRNEYDTPQ